MSRHVVITGPMGSGKTTVGSELAGRLGYHFHDSDQHIEHRHGLTGRQIAGDQGVPALHRLERGFLDEMLRADRPAVIAAAASIADDEELLHRLVAAGNRLVFLTVDSDRLTALAQQGAHRRPIDHNAAVVLYNRRHEAAVAAGAIICPALGPDDPADLLEAALRTG